MNVEIIARALSTGNFFHVVVFWSRDSTSNSSEVVFMITYPHHTLSPCHVPPSCFPSCTPPSCPLIWSLLPHVALFALPPAFSNPSGLLRNPRDVSSHKWQARELLRDCAHCRIERKSSMVPADDVLSIFTQPTLVILIKENLLDVNFLTRFWRNWMLIISGWCQKIVSTWTWLSLGGTALSCTQRDSTLVAKLTAIFQIRSIRQSICSLYCLTYVRVSSWSHHNFSLVGS